jgi:rhamnosyltransferase
MNKEYRRNVELLTSVIAPDKLNLISNRLYLVKNFKQLRRRSRDRYFLLLMLLLNIY